MSALLCCLEGGLRWRTHWIPSRAIFKLIFQPHWTPSKNGKHDLQAWGLLLQLGVSRSHVCIECRLMAICRSSPQRCQDDHQIQGARLDWRTDRSYSWDRTCIVWASKKSAIWWPASQWGQEYFHTLFATNFFRLHLPLLSQNPSSDVHATTLLHALLDVWGPILLYVSSITLLMISFPPAKPAQPKSTHSKLMFTAPLAVQHVHFNVNANTIARLSQLLLKGRLCAGTLNGNSWKPVSVVGENGRLVKPVFSLPDSKVEGSLSPAFEGPHSWAGETSKHMHLEQGKHVMFHRCIVFANVMSTL